MRTRTLSTLALTATLTLSLAVLGCGDGDDSPTDPGAGGGGAVTDTEAVMAAEFATPVAVAMVEQATSVAGLDLGGLGEMPPMGFARFGDDALRRAAEASFSISWDSESMEWVVLMSENQMPAMSMDFEHRVQYRDASGDPQGYQEESPETTDGARFSTDAAVFMDMGAMIEEQGVEGTVDVEYGSTMTIAGLLGDTYAAVGTGTYSLDVAMTAQHEGQTQSMDIDLEMAYAMDVSIPAAGGCPTGTSSMTYAGYRVTVDFDGSATGAWTLTRLSDGAVLLSGTEALGCGVTAAR